jgi:hypothetical protein
LNVTASDTSVSAVKDPLEMGDGITLIVTLHNPGFSLAAGEKGSEVVGINEDACLNSQIDHLFWGIGSIELSLHDRVVIHLKAEVIQSI